MVFATKTEVLAVSSMTLKDSRKAGLLALDLNIHAVILMQYFPFEISRRHSLRTINFKW